MTIRIADHGSTLRWQSVQHDEVNDRRIFNQDHRGVGSLGAVAAVMIAFCIGGGLMWKTYREGPSSRPATAQCAWVCS